MTKPRAKSPGTANRSPAKVAITLRLDPDRARRLQTIAESENRTLTNYVETALIRDLALRDEAGRVITMRSAPGTSARIAPEDVARTPDESDAAFATRCDLVLALWQIEDSD